MVNKNIYEFPVIYTNPIPEIALGWAFPASPTPRVSR